MSFPEAVTCNWLAGVNQGQMGESARAWSEAAGNLAAVSAAIFVVLKSICSATWSAILIEVN
jgi:hypothetical protein